MHAQLIEKPMIFAICGKSASGKDTLAKYLSEYFYNMGLFTHNMISVTTRPPRVGEKNKINYYFTSEHQFEQMMEHQEFIEFTHFRGWHYGVPLNEVKSGYINIGVFNPEGLMTLQAMKYNYWIVPIYIDETFRLRMRRSYAREGKWKLEFFRRAITDYFDFRHIDLLLKRFRGKYIYLKNIDDVKSKAIIITNTLYNWGLLYKEDNEVRLGNFI